MSYDSRCIAEYEKCDEQGVTYVEIILIEKTTEYVHVGVSVDDGGWRAFLPLSNSFLVYRDGIVDI